MDGMPIKLFMTATTALPLGFLRDQVCQNKVRMHNICRQDMYFFYIVERPA